MSWISELAGKAENFLNNLDNSAAQALNKSQDNLDKRQYNRRTEPTSIKEYDKLSQGNIEHYNTGDSIKSLPLKISGNKSFPVDSNKDQNLFQFNYNSDIKRSRSDVFSNNNMETLSDKGSSGYRTVNDDFYDKSSEILNVASNINNNPSIENKLLRSEISSLNQEISSLLQRNHKSEEENKRLRNQLEKVSGQLRESDRKLRELNSVKDDLDETLKVKDQKLTVLYSEIQLLNTKKSDFSSIGDANVISDHRNKIILLEQELRAKNEALEKIEGEKLHWQNNWDDAKLKLTETVNYYEKTRIGDKRRLEMLTEQLELSKQKTTSIQNDLKEYKIKAANILQMKEKIIASLKGSDETVDDKFLYGASAEDVQSELSNVRRECDLLREEVARCRLELEHKDFDLQELDHQMHTETESLRKNLDLLEEQLDRERQLREDVDADYRQLTRENRHLQEKYMREKADFHDHLASKDEEIARTRQMISTKQANQTDQVVELESRVRALTDTLIQKQAALDSSKADHHSLQIRLERTETELSSLQKPSVAMASINNDRKGLIGLGNSDFVTINMRDAPVTKNLKTALNSLDKLSLRTGLFLRRYPPARLFFIFYTILLHFWVLFVFLTYQPEIHMGNANVPNVPSIMNAPAMPVPRKRS